MTLKTVSLDASWTYTLNRFNEFTLGTQGFIQSNVNNGKRVIPGWGGGGSFLQSVRNTGCGGFRRGLRSSFTFAISFEFRI
ncbi:MAG: hypothetical protein IPG09_04935 [Ignavibacteria bacterium]|nr:hypothetical protein [Ignavibacteria bacterium]